MYSFRHHLLILMMNFERCFAGQWNFKATHQWTSIHIVLKQALCNDNISYIYIRSYASGNTVNTILST